MRKLKIKKSIFALVLFCASMLMSSCTKEFWNGITLSSPSTVILRYGESFFIEASSFSDITYYSEDEYYAIVRRDGEIIANHVGETSIILESNYDTKVIRVIVDPRYDMYVEPSIDWGMGYDTFIRKYGSPDYKSELGVVYENQYGDGVTYYYDFDNYDELCSATVVMAYRYLDDVIGHVEERYEFYEEGRYYYFYANGFPADYNKTGIEVSWEYSNQTTIYYYPYGSWK